MGVASSSVPCGTCRLCCRQQIVFLLPGDDAEALGAVPDREPSGRMGMRLPVDAEGDCVHLTESGCGVYSIRPKVCAGFSCMDHYFLPAAERRNREMWFGPRDMEIVARGRFLVESSR